MCVCVCVCVCMTVSIILFCVRVFVMSHSALSNKICSSLHLIKENFSAKYSHSLNCVKTLLQICNV